MPQIHGLAPVDPKAQTLRPKVPKNLVLPIEVLVIFQNLFRGAFEERSLEAQFGNAGCYLLNNFL